MPLVERSGRNLKSINLICHRTPSLSEINGEKSINGRPTEDVSRRFPLRAPAITQKVVRVREVHRGDCIRHTSGGA